MMAPGPVVLAVGPVVLAPGPAMLAPGPAVLAPGPAVRRAAALAPGDAHPQLPPLHPTSGSSSAPSWPHPAGTRLMETPVLVYDTQR